MSAAPAAALMVSSLLVVVASAWVECVPSPAGALFRHSRAMPTGRQAQLRPLFQACLLVADIGIMCLSGSGAELVVLCRRAASQQRLGGHN